MDTLKAYKIPTDDPAWHSCPLPGERVPSDVILTDETGQQRCRVRWYSADCPDRRHRYFTLNCYRYRLQWED